MASADYFIDIQGASLKVKTNKGLPGKPVIVFLHDSLGCIELWRDFPEKLANACDGCYFIYDRQGYGESSPFDSLTRNSGYLEKEADILHQLLKSEQLQNVILFGHSDGGSIALIAASKYPEHIIGVITEGAHVFVEEETLDGIRSVVEAYNTTNLPAKLSKYHGVKTEQVFKAWTETWLSSLFRDWNIESFLPDIKCPVLAIQGEMDEFGTEAQVDSIVSKVSGHSEKFMVEGAFHTPHKEQQEITLARTTTFLHEILK